MILFEKLDIPYEKVKWKDTVLVKCDYCGREVHKTKAKIQKGRKAIDKDSCINDSCTKKKLAEVNLSRYGVKNPFQRSEIKDKIKKTNLERHGVEYAQQSSKIRAKSRATCLKNHGTEHALQNKEILAAAQKSSFDKYGTKFPVQLDVFKAKVRNTNRKRYGVDNFLDSDEVKKRIKETNIKKYGSPFPIKKFGKIQESIRSWLNSHGFNFISDFEVLEGKELDFYERDQKLALEYCGLYWHNENSPQPRTRSYHHDKWRRCREKGIQLITIFDDEWNAKGEICKSMILSKLGIFETRIQARRCATKEISKKEMGDFCEAHHLQGANKLSHVCFGLFHGEELVGVVDLGRHHRKKNNDSVVLTRLCFKTGLQVVGGSGKLFKACVDWCRENEAKKIISWSDNRYSDGSVYGRLGFKKAGELPPDYCYVNMKNPKRRFSKQSQSKKQANCPPHMTELQWANSRGLSRIWDCGKVRWEFEISV